MLTSCELGPLEQILKEFESKCKIHEFENIISNMAVISSALCVLMNSNDLEDTQKGALDTIGNALDYL